MRKGRGEGIVGDRREEKEGWEREREGEKGRGEGMVDKGGKREGWEREGGKREGREKGWRGRGRWERELRKKNHFAV